MSMITRLLDTSTSVLGPNRVEAIAGTSNLARDGHIVDMRGMDTQAFMRAGTILWAHDQQQPVGNPVSCYVDGGGNLRIVVDFAPEGVSSTADEIRRLVKAGVVRNMSIGFEPVETEPLDPRNPRGGQRILRAELLEVSFVSVPADPGAVVTARAARAGKALSASNEQALRDAHQLADQCRSTLAGVLDGACTDAQRGQLGFERRQRELDAINLAAGASPALREHQQLIERAKAAAARGNADHAQRLRDLADLSLK